MGKTNTLRNLSCCVQRYIILIGRGLQNDHKKLKNNYAEEQTENQRLRDVVKNKDYELSKAQQEKYKLCEDNSIEF